VVIPELALRRMHLNGDFPHRVSPSVVARFADSSSVISKLDQLMDLNSFSFNSCALQFPTNIALQPVFPVFGLHFYDKLTFGLRVLT
jgi:hypothetical protein